MNKFIAYIIDAFHSTMEVIISRTFWVTLATIFYVDDCIPVEGFFISLGICLTGMILSLFIIAGLRKYERTYNVTNKD